MKKAFSIQPSAFRERFVSFFNSLLKNSKKPNGTPAFAGVTVKVEREISTKTVVMPAQAGIPFSCFHSPSSSKTVFQQTAKEQKNA